MQYPLPLSGAATTEQLRDGQLQGSTHYITLTA